MPQIQRQSTIYIKFKTHLEDNETLIQPKKLGKNVVQLIEYLPSIFAKGLGPGIA